jgi:hypothetical protein
MGFNKTWIDAEKIISAWKEDGAQGVVDLYIKYDAVIMEDKTSIRIGTIMQKEKSTEYKKKLIKTYMQMMLEGEVNIK